MYLHTLNDQYFTADSYKDKLQCEIYFIKNIKNYFNSDKTTDFYSTQLDTYIFLKVMMHIKNQFYFIVKIKNYFNTDKITDFYSAQLDTSF